MSLFRKPILLILLLAMIWAVPCTRCSAADDNAPKEKAPSLRDLEALAGRWIGESGGAVTEECWMAPAGGLMVGMNRTTGAGGRSFFEFLRIEETPEGLAYIASPRGGPATTFRLLSLEKDKVVFHNPGHDYPQKIIYRWEEEDRLLVRVEGLVKGKLEAGEWKWRRVSAGPAEKALKLAEDIPAPVSQVWQAWTTEEGVRTFFAPQARIRLAPMGEYEMYFMPEAPEGSRGGEGCRILALEPEKMLTFTWNAPTRFPEIRKQFTTVILRFEPLGEKSTRVHLTQVGWGEGGDWQKTYDYFHHAWGKVVLPALRSRFTTGPRDWNAPTKPVPSPAAS